MIRETVKLMPGRDEVYLDYYGNDDRSEVADAMLVIPGGGYGAVCSDREGEPIALSYLTKGINAFVLHYSVGSEIKDPLDPLTEASLAMLHIRANAQKYNINPARVFAVGFSAGGHLTGSLGTLWNDAELQARLPEAGDGNRPTGVVLCYPVISSSNIGHMGSFSNLLRSQTPDAAALERFSLEKHVGAHTPPAFIMHTYADALVPVEKRAAHGAGVCPRRMCRLKCTFTRAGRTASRWLTRSHGAALTTWYARRRALGKRFG